MKKDVAPMVSKKADTVVAANKASGPQSGIFIYLNSQFADCYVCRPCCLFSIVANKQILVRVLYLWSAATSHVPIAARLSDFTRPCGDARAIMGKDW